ncbi:putative short-chain dehydrogenase protein [Phaeoacremonium minimum UCRPA7]|uniref:Putative short-chain dehydrogenase protein n=1 Tax=Phaeoacremonium minimum (strain UCR-PA7) TaxID=1286976 RepID=R8BVB5_PHAM7|nr:putative short-chain dehydrogenase protein [Phaeoacremonium minimum UCRPA7]EOO03321.1 putative short-chain dehydrogenase protein [Phaeoacremonium minimum UCRPA7]
MSETKRTVLITGCSDGGMGAALAAAFHKAGLHVYATARNPAKMEQLASMGIETLAMDVESEASITACVSKVPTLDILVNNAGAQFLMPVVDINIAEARKLYDLNVWAYVAVVQAFLPLLLKSKGMIVNQTSIGAVTTLPFQAVYNSSKAAMAMITDSMRLELQPFGIKVIDLRTGIVKTNLIKNLQDVKQPSLPEGSIYEPAKEVLENVMRQEGFETQGVELIPWAEATVQALLKKNPSSVIWRGEQALLSRVTAIFPHGLFDAIIKKFTGLDDVEDVLKKYQKGK